MIDILAGLFELSGLTLIGRKKWIGFVLNIIGCSIWVYVAITTGIYGLLIVVLPAIFINANNIRKWKI